VLDADVLALAEAQHGVVAVRQLTHTLGRSARSVSRARQQGVLLDVAPGVVRLRSSPETFLQRCHAAQLWLRGVGFLSGWTAGRLVGLRSMPDEPIHITAPTTFRRTPSSWMQLHITGWYDEVDDRTVGPEGLATATPLRMLWGLAAAFNQHRFERAAEDAWHLGLLTPTDAADYLETHRCRGKDGVQRMEIWLERAVRRDRASQSNLERRLLDALAAVGLPTPDRQYPVTLRDGSTIHFDIAWPEIRLAVEPGASWWHGGDLRQRRDQARDRACLEVGWRVVRFDDAIADDYLRAAREVARIHRRLTMENRNLASS
jgi:very-short-patch-repair endonuclease